MQFPTSIAVGFFVTAAASHAATVYAFDIDSTSPGPITTATGWMSYPMGSTGNGTPVVADGISFSVGSADGSRTRPTGANDLTRDFAFDDGAGQALIFFFGEAGDLASGTWQVEVWAHDASSPVGDQFVGYRTNGTETQITATAAAHTTDPISTFTFESDGVSAYDVYLRENNTENRSRLSAVRLTFIPEPSTGILALLGGLTLLRRRRG